MMITKSKIVLIMMLLVTASLSAQSTGIEIFGFYQARLSKEVGEYSVTGNLPAALGGKHMKFLGMEQKRISPYAQQLNLMFRKEFSPNVSTFLNFEIINNFSTDKNWGAFSLDELWLNYEYAGNHSIKGGLLVPKFNNLNEIKNRMPLLPYILRPIIYEPSFRSILDPSDFLPEKAFVQMQGKFFAGQVELNYAAYAGSSESSYIVSGSSVGSASSGTDTTNFKLFGGRLGFDYKDLRIGVSTSFDKDNQKATLNEDVKRTRLGFDIGASLYGFTLDGELIKVLLDPRNTTKDLNKIFYYATLSYDFTDQFFGYGTYSYYEDKASDFLSSGLTNIMFGGGYRANDNVVLKVQYHKTNLDGTVPITINPALPPITANSKLDFQFYSFAISVLF